MSEPSPNNPEHSHGRVRRLAGALKHHARKVASSISTTAKRMATKHQDCMRENRNYRQAVLTGTTAIVTALTLDPFSAAFVTAAVAIYVAAFQDGDDRGTSGWRPDDPYRSW